MKSSFPVRQSKPDNRSQVSPGYVMMGRQPVATGCIQVRGLKLDRKCNAAELTILPVLAFTKTGPGPGPRIVESCTTAPLAILRASPGTWNADRFGGVRRNRNGSAMM